jgi:hypothetical protein
MEKAVDQLTAIDTRIKEIRIQRKMYLEELNKLRIELPILTKNKAKIVDNMTCHMKLYWIGPYGCFVDARLPHCIAVDGYNKHYPDNSVSNKTRGWKKNDIIEKKEWLDLYTKYNNVVDNYVYVD